MEDKLPKISENENTSNYNYEEFVRTIKKEDNFVINKNKFEEIENKFFQKEVNIDNTQASDVTSISLSQTENLSQTSENILIPNDSNQNSLWESQKGLKLNIRELDYFYGYENYFRKISPEKFIEYRNSRNFIPKKRKDINKSQNNASTVFNENSHENKYNQGVNNFQMGTNFYCCPTNGNIVYFLYNNFFFNFNNIQSQSQNITKEMNDNNNKEEDKKEIIGNKNNNEIEAGEKKKMNVIGDESDSIYIIQKKNNKNKNKNNKQSSYKPIKQEKPIEIKYKDKDYNYHYYNNKNNYYYNNNNYNKFNGNYEKRKKKFYNENNFHKKKYYRENFY